MARTGIFPTLDGFWATYTAGYENAAGKQTFLVVTGADDTDAVVLGQYGSYYVVASIRKNALSCRCTTLTQDYTLVNTSSQSETAFAIKNLGGIHNFGYRFPASRSESFWRGVLKERIVDWFFY